MGLRESGGEGVLVSLPSHVIGSNQQLPKRAGKLWTAELNHPPCGPLQSRLKSPRSDRKYLTGNFLLCSTAQLEKPSCNAADGGEEEDSRVNQLSFIWGGCRAISTPRAKLPVLHELYQWARRPITVEQTATLCVPHCLYSVWQTQIKTCDYVSGTEKKFH